MQRISCNHRACGDVGAQPRGSYILPMRLHLMMSAALPIALSSCLRPTPAPAPVDSSAPTAIVLSPAPVITRSLDTAAWVDSTLATLSLRQRAAQLVVLWTLGDYT